MGTRDNESMGLTRRGFLTGALALGAVGAGSMLAGCSSEGGAGAPASDERAWDQETDVVVVGTGFAGLAAAHEAAKAGSQVVLVEKAPEKYAGGNSRACAQAIWSPEKTAEGVAYFKEITGDYHLVGLDDAVIEAYIGGAKENADWLLDEFEIETKTHNACEYPAAKTASAVGDSNTLIPAEGWGNARVWAPMFEVVGSESGVTSLFETAFTDLVFNEAGEAIGIEAQQGESPLLIKAKKGVVLACGGFEYNEEMKANNCRYPSLAWGTPYNTGDALTACRKYDIDFWHMNSATPATRVGVQATWLDDDFSECGFDCEVAGDAGYVWTDKYGKRFMDETRSYQHGYGRDALFYNDSAKMEWPRLPFWQVVDESTLPFMGTSGSGWVHIVGGTSAPDSTEELLSSGLMVKADTVEELASQMGVEATILQESVDALSGPDDEFGRAAEKKRALSGTLYAVQLQPIMVNTNGGPKRDASARIVHTDGTPVERLFSAGELGSVWAWYYQGAGNVSECMVFGRIAGRNAAALTPWDAEA